MTEGAAGKSWRAWAMELGRARITVNAVISVAATGMTETMPFLQPYIDALKADEPLPAYARRELGFGSPEDAAGLIAWHSEVTRTRF